jgi:hypothetical protein
MDLIGSDIRLIHKAAKLNFIPTRDDCHRHRYIKDLMTTISGMVPTMYESVDRKLEPMKPKKFAPEEQSRSGPSTLKALRRQKVKTEWDWQVQCGLETEHHCLNTKGVSCLLQIDRRIEKSKARKRWEIRRFLDLSFLQEPNLSTNSMAVRLSAEMEYDDYLRTLDNWLRFKCKCLMPELTQSEMLPLIAWQAWERLSAPFRCGIWLFDTKKKYLFVFHRYACTNQQAYLIVKCLRASKIRSVVALLDTSDFKEKIGNEMKSKDEERPQRPRDDSN